MNSDYNRKFNLTLIVIINDVIEMSDLFKRIEKSGLKDMKLNAPVNPLTGQNVPLTISITNQSFTFKNVLDGKDVSISNINYGDTVRGIFQIQIINTMDLESGNKVFEDLKNLIEEIKYPDIFAYEFSINMVVEHTEYPVFDKINKLTTFKKPRWKAIKILEGDEENKDLRHEYIKEISVEKNVSNLKTSVVNAVYRLKKFDPNILKNAFNDVNKILNLLKGE